MQRLSIALLLVAATSLSGACSDVPVSPGPTSSSAFTGGNSEGAGLAGATALSICNYLASCGGFSQEQLAGCRASAEDILQILPDPLAVVACILSVPCNALGEDSIDDRVSECARILSSQCVGGALQLCNEAGVCATTACTQVCKALGLSGGTCRSGGGNLLRCDCDFQFGQQQRSLIDALTLP